MQDNIFDSKTIALLGRRVAKGNYKYMVSGEAKLWHGNVLGAFYDPQRHQVITFSPQMWCSGQDNQFSILPLGVKKNAIATTNITGDCFAEPHQGNEKSRTITLLSRGEL
jgi:hypothetical protein